MHLQYEVYLMNTKFDEYIIGTFNSLSSAKAAAMRIKKDTAFAKLVIDTDLAGTQQTRTARFTGTPGIDRWLCWTDSHGRPAKRLLTRYEKAEIKGE